MKRILMVFIAILSTGVFAQGGTHEKGQFNLYAGLTFNNGHGNLYNYGGGNFKLGPSISLTYGIHQDISIGGMAITTFGGSKRTRFHNDHSHVYKYRHFNFYLGPRAAYHFGTLLNMPDNLDWYAGASLGTLFYSSKYSEERNDFGEVNQFADVSNVNGLSLYTCALTGFKWNFASSVGLYAEVAVGYHINYGQIGIAFQF